MSAWSQLKPDRGKGVQENPYLSWMKTFPPTEKSQKNESSDARQGGLSPKSKPIEPEKRLLSKGGLVKWVIFILVVAYVLASYYRAPVLTSLGKYLVVEHPLKTSDLIVCLMGKPVERGLEAAELYKEKLAPLIFVARGELPEGQSMLVQKKVAYPETRDLLIKMLGGLGVPESACISRNQFVDNTFEEAKAVKAFTLERGYHSLILVTSPTHARRAWLTFRKVFGEEDVDIMVSPSRYSDFRPEAWWQSDKNFRDVVFEYEKLIYYYFKYF